MNGLAVIAFAIVATGAVYGVIWAALAVTSWVDSFTDIDLGDADDI